LLLIMLSWYAQYNRFGYTLQPKQLYLIFPRQV
jgi:hypothetical protein